MNTKSPTECLRDEIRKTNRFACVVLILVVFVGLPLVAYTVFTPTTPKEPSKETWISLQPQQPTHLDSGICVTEAEDGQLVILDSKRFDRLTTQATAYEVRVQKEVFTRSSGEKIPFWVVTGIRRK